jgi:hypothetical protein
MARFPSGRLDRFHLLILDDLAYVTKDQAETSVLFGAFLEIFPQSSEEWVTDLSLGRLCAIFDLGQQLGLDPDALVRDPLRERLRLPAQEVGEGLGRGKDLFGALHGRPPSQAERVRARPRAAQARTPSATP